MKLANVFEVAYGPLDRDELEPRLRSLANSALEQRFGDVGYKRLFVQQLIPELRGLRAAS